MAIRRLAFVLLVLLAVDGRAVAERGGDEIAREIERTGAALEALSAGDPAEAARVLGVEISAEAAAAFKDAVSRRKDVLDGLVEVAELRAAIPDEREARERARRAATARIDVPPGLPETVTEEALAKIEFARTEAQTARERAVAALRQARSRAEVLEREAAELNRRRGALRKELEAAGSGDALGVYRRATIEREIELVTARADLAKGWGNLVELLQIEADAASEDLARKARLQSAAHRGQEAWFKEEEAAAREKAALAEAVRESEADPVERYRGAVRVQIHLHRAEEMADRRALLALAERRAGEEQKDEELGAYTAQLKRRFTAGRSAAGRAGDTLMRALRLSRAEKGKIERTRLPGIETDLGRYGERADRVQDELMDLALPPEDLPFDLASLHEETPAEDRERATSAYLEERGKLLGPLRRRERVLRMIQAELAELDTIYDLRLETMEELEAFALSRLYRVRNAAPLGAATLSAVATEIEDIVLLYGNPAIPESVGRSYRAHTGRWVFTAIGFIALVGLGAWLSRRLRGMTSHHGYRGRRFLAVLKRIGVAILIAAPLPLGLVAAALLLVQLQLPAAVEGPLLRLLLALAALSYLRRLFRSLFRDEEGILVADFGVSPDVAAQLRRTGRFVLAGGLLLLVPWLVLRTPVLRSENISRVLYVAMLAYFGTIVLVLHRRNAPLVAAVTRRQGAMYRFGPLIWSVFALALAAIVIGDAVGYRYGSALLLGDFLLGLATLWVLFLVYLGLSRLVEETAPRLLRRRDSETDAAEARRQSREVVEQAGRVISTALIAAAVFALLSYSGITGLLGRILGDVRIKEVDPGSDLWLTLLDVCVAALWIAGTHFLIRNRKGVFEVFVFPRMKRRDPGTRFVALTVSKYLIILVGYGAVLLTLQFSFASLGWLLAAASVGLGFGLQEIVSNFISGLILFFERPVRVGDVVTVEGTTGTVEGISIRATQVLDFDRKVIIIPNRRFIVDDVVNWSHNDLVVRRRVEVGVAYGTDVRRVADLLLDVARACPLVKSHPAPSVLFSTFGSSSLDMVLLVYSNIEHRLKVASELNMAISRRFEEEGITIPFPQQDLHLRSIADAAAIRVVDPGPEAAGG